jgi:hypothetical protein
VTVTVYVIDLPTRTLGALAVMLTAISDLPRAAAGCTVILNTIRTARMLRAGRTMPRCIGYPLELDALLMTEMGY